MSRAADLISRRREASIAFVAVVLFVYFWVTTDAFFTSNNLRVVTQFTTPVAMLAIAQVMNLVGGEIDLSLGNVYALTPFVMISAQDWGLPLPVALVFAVVVASLVGLTNGVITLTTGVPSFITTLGMLFFLNGLTLTISDGFPKPAPEGGFAEWIGGADFSGFWWAVGFTVVLHIVLTNTRWGVYTIATGGNPVGAAGGRHPDQADQGRQLHARRRPRRVHRDLEGIRIDSFVPLAGGPDLMFLGVAAAVIGGTALFGGSGTIIGAFLGAFVLGVLRDGLSINGVSAFTYNMILGAAVIASMILNAAANRVRIRMRRT